MHSKIVSNLLENKGFWLYLLYNNVFSRRLQLRKSRLEKLFSGRLAVGTNTEAFTSFAAKWEKMLSKLCQSLEGGKISKKIVGLTICQPKKLILAT